MTPLKRVIVLFRITIFLFVPSPSIPMNASRSQESYSNPPHLRLSFSYYHLPTPLLASFPPKKVIASLQTPIPLSSEELSIVYASAQSAQQVARMASKKWEEDDESLALELELEFTQLDPITRVELLKQLDAAEQEQFTESGARSERLSRAAKEASFHNAQLSADRSRLGPYYYDPHTRSQQAYHAIAITETQVDATVLDATNPSLTVINPELPLPRNFQYFPHQPGDLNLTMKGVDQNGDHPSPLTSSNLSSHSQPSVDQVQRLSSVINKVHQTTTRYAVMDGYAQWLKAEISNHKLASAPLDPYSSWTQQFLAQWAVLQPQGCFDFLPTEQGSGGAQKSTTLLSSLSTTSGASDTDQKQTAKVSMSVRNVWKAHRKHLEAEHAVVLAMEGAERARRRVKFGDPEDRDIDPGKPLTRDERRKLSKREKEHQKMKAFFLREKKKIFGESFNLLAKKFLSSINSENTLTASTGSLMSSSNMIPSTALSSSNRSGLTASSQMALASNSFASSSAEPNYLGLLLHQLSWYDMSTLYLSLGFSMAQLLDEDHGKDFGASGAGLGGDPSDTSLKPRSHKKGAAKAAKLAAKRLNDAAVSHAPLLPSATTSMARTPKSASNALYVESTPGASPAVMQDSPGNKNVKKRGRTINVDIEDDDEDDDEDYEERRVVGGAGGGLLRSLEENRNAERSSSLYRSQLSQANPTPEYSQSTVSYASVPARPTAQCLGCGAMDDPQEMVRCSLCSSSYHTYCLDDQDINLQQWTCPRCAL